MWSCEVILRYCRADTLWFYLPFSHFEFFYLLGAVGQPSMSSHVLLTIICFFTDPPSFFRFPGRGRPGSVDILWGVVHDWRSVLCWTGDHHHEVRRWLCLPSRGIWTTPSFPTTLGKSLLSKNLRLNSMVGWLMSLRLTRVSVFLGNIENLTNVV